MRNAQAEAAALVDSSYEVRVLEPSPPTSTDPDFFADDPATRGDTTATVITPTSAGDATWQSLADIDGDIAAFAQEHWLAEHRRLNPVPANYPAIRDDFHRLAYGVVATARMHANGKFGLRYTHRGFGTPFFGDEVQIRVANNELIKQTASAVEAVSITTLHDAAEFVGTTPSSDPGEHDSPELGDLNRTLLTTSEVNDFLGDWYGFAFSVLEELRVTPGAEQATRIQLWPGHFDPALEIGDADKGQRATYGMSPGDAGHDEPYLYVGAWGDVDRTNPFWNETAFNGASMPYAELLKATDQREAALSFFRTGLDSLLSNAS